MKFQLSLYCGLNLNEMTSYCFVSFAIICTLKNLLCWLNIIAKNSAQYLNNKIFICFQKTLPFQDVHMKYTHIILIRRDIRSHPRLLIPTIWPERSPGTYLPLIWKNLFKWGKQVREQVEGILSCWDCPVSAVPQHHAEKLSNQSEKM